ncbi:MAG: SUMF1/EgtB/PvdO family nonheme iron enzyme [Spirochaetaceae bacterium]
MSKAEASTIEVEPVHLKPVFGMEPGKWLAVVLSVAGAVILLGFLLLPGLLDRHVVYQFDSTPEGASVHLNGRRIGSTPLTYDVPAGSHTVTFLRPFFAAEEREIAVSGRIFGSLIAPETDDLNVSLGPRDSVEASAAAIIREASRDFSEWAALGAERPDRPVPPILVPAARDLSALGVDANERTGFLLPRLQDVTSAALLQDLVQALDTRTRQETERTSELPQPDEIVSFFEQYEVFSQNWGRWLATILPSDMVDDLRASDSYQAELEANRALENGYSEYVLATATEAQTEAPLDIGGSLFQPVPAGEVLLGFRPALGVEDRSPARTNVALSQFWVSTRPVTVGEFREFLDENPEWRSTAYEELYSLELVDEGYLADFNGAPDNRPVTGVSWHAATEYARWFDERYSGEIERIGSDLRARLPGEAEWAWAAILDRHEYGAQSFAFSRSTGPAVLTGERTGRLGLEDMLGNVWEWTADPWYRSSDVLRFERPLSDEGPGNTFPRVVRGGSWANTRAAVGIESRGGQPAHWSTPFLGFRLVIGEVE